MAWIPELLNATGRWCPNGWRFATRAEAVAFCEDLRPLPESPKPERWQPWRGEWRVRENGDASNCRYEPRDGARGQVIWNEELEHDNVIPISHYQTQTPNRNYRRSANPKLAR